jgi:hypothetical protein
MDSYTCSAIASSNFSALDWRRCLAMDWATSSGMDFLAAGKWI